MEKYSKFSTRNREKEQFITHTVWKTSVRSAFKYQIEFCYNLYLRLSLNWQDLKNALKKTFMTTQHCIVSHVGVTNNPYNPIQISQKFLLFFQISTIFVCVCVSTCIHKIITIHDMPLLVGRFYTLVGGQAFYWAKTCVVRDFSQHLKENILEQGVFLCDGVVLWLQTCSCWSIRVSWHYTLTQKHTPISW